MKVRVRIIPALLVAALIGGTQVATASDAVQAAVTIPADQPSAIVTQNGNPLANGTFAVGTIQLLYVVHANEFPVGPFGSFTIDLGIKPDYDNGKVTTYPVELTLEQVGGGPILTPSPDSFSVSGRSWNGSSTVSIAIPAGLANGDGDEIVGNLQLAAGAHLKTPTTVQVHIKLVHPTECIKLYDFVTDAAFTETITSTEVNINSRKNAINATNPYGQLSENVLVVNTCPSAQAFDAKVTLDPAFLTSPSGNPGNAVFTFFITGQEDDTIDIAALGTGTPRGQQLCLTNVTLNGGDSFLATVKTGIDKSLPANTLGTSGTFSFSAQLYAAGSGCATELVIPVLPSNPVTASLSYTVK